MTLITPEICKTCGLHIDFQNLKVRIGELEEALRMCLFSSCTCLTKTPEVRYHDVNCRYRKIKEVLGD